MPFWRGLLENGEFERVEEGLAVEPDGLLKRLDAGRREVGATPCLEVSEQVEERDEVGWRSGRRLVTPFVWRPEVSLLLLVWAGLFCLLATGRVGLKGFEALPGAMAEEFIPNVSAAESEEPRAWEGEIP